MSINFDLMTPSGPASPNSPEFPLPQASPRYRLFRSFLRLWLALIFRKIRLLQAHLAPAGGPVLLVVNHPASYFDALLLLAAMERPVRCLLQANLVRGPFRRLFAWGLEVTPFEQGENQIERIDAATALLRQGWAVMIFAEERMLNQDGSPWMSIAIAESALKDSSGRGIGESLKIVPVHLFLPVAPSQSEELLVQLATPVSTVSADGQDKSRLALETALRFAFHRNPFRLQPANLEIFMEDVQAILIEELEEEWAAHPKWKQKSDGFVLSSYVTGMVKSLNETHPGRLVGLREALDRLAGKRRELALRQFKIETADKWIKSPIRKLAVWAEGIVGVGVAAYGALNHLIIAAVLAWLGLLRRGLDASAGEWVGRGITLVCCYAAQVALVSRFEGRAAAGYYLLSLIISGVYMLRYAWLYRHRASILLGSVTMARQKEKLTRHRRNLVESFNLARDLYTASQSLSRA